MIHTINLNLLLEIAFRFFLWILFVYYDGADPFIRDISAEELYLYDFPPTVSYVPSKLLWFIIVLTPIVVCAVSYVLTSDATDSKQVLMALTFSYPLNGFITSIVKVAVGRPRPDFVRRCFPQGPPGDFANCTGVRRVYLDGRKSFPSGHSSFAFVCMTFMTLYLARKLKFNSGQSWKVSICIVPLLIAALIAISRTCDYHHHYQDVTAGSILGAAIAYLTFLIYFPKPTTT